MSHAPGLVVWFTGLPASGKSTWAARLQEDLRERGSPVCLLDGDDIRRLVRPDLGYNEKDRNLHYRSLAELAAYIARQGHIVLVAATAHKKSYRADAREVAPHFLEVFVDTPISLCHKRDPKALYRNSQSGALPLPGAGIPYEPPDSPDYKIDASASDEKHCGKLCALILDKSGQ
jgi:adenylylsulfate kinase